MLTPEYLVSREWNEGVAKLIALEGRAKGEALFALLSSALRSDEMMLFHFRHGVSADIIEHRTPPITRQQQMAAYRDGLYLIDPFYLAIERATESQAISLRDVVDQDEFELSEFYKRHYGDTHIVDELCYCFADGVSGHVLLSFARMSATGRYNDGELAVGKALAPIVLAALQASWTDFVDGALLAPPTEEEVKLQRVLRTARDNFGLSILTDREFEVTQMMLRGYPIGLIATRLKMAEGTTKVHRRNIYRKLDIGSKSELFLLFIDAVGEARAGKEVDPLLGYEQRWGLD